MKVHRALLYSVDGIFEPPEGKPGDFSSQNWADVEEAQPRHDGGTSKSVSKLIRKASIYSSRLMTLKAAHWTAIIDGAKAMVVKKGKARAEDHGQVEIIADDDGDDTATFHDPMFD
jgi:hypothetical protein